jgi:metallothiol transferase
MAIVIDHLTVPVRDQEASVRFYADVFGARQGATRGRIVGVWLSDDLELQLRATQPVETSHYAFRVDRLDFETALGQLRALGIPYGVSRDELNGALLEERGKRSVFFSDPDGHSLELISHNA